MKVIISAYINNDTWVNTLISMWTWFKNPFTPHTSHTEIVLPLMGVPMSFSSTNRDGAHGTRWEDPKKTYRHPEKWLYYEKDYSDEEALEMVKRADSILGVGYDWLGIAGFATPLGLINNKEKWYCSEAVWFVLTGKWIRRISPRAIVSKIKKMEFKLCLRESLPF